MGRTACTEPQCLYKGCSLQTPDFTCPIQTYDISDSKSREHAERSVLGCDSEQKDWQVFERNCFPRVEILPFCLIFITAYCQHSIEFKKQTEQHAETHLCVSVVVCVVLCIVLCKCVLTFLPPQSDNPIAFNKYNIISRIFYRMFQNIHFSLLLKICTLIFLLNTSTKCCAHVRTGIVACYEESSLLV
jgi:hypothetical protein